METLEIKEPEWEKIFFTWLPEKQLIKLLVILDEEINLNENYYFLKGILYEFGLNKKSINYTYSMEFYQQGIQKKNYLSYFRFFFMYLNGNSNFNIDKNEEVGYYFLVKACAYFNQVDTFRFEINPLSILRMKINSMNIETFNNFLETLSKVHQNFHLEEYEIHYITTFVESYYEELRHVNDNEGSDSSGDEYVYSKNKKDYFEENLSGFCATTFHKEAINQMIAHYIHTRNNKKILKAVKLYKNFANLKFFGLLWNYLFTFHSYIHEYDQIYQEISSILKIKLKFLQNYRLYANFFSSQEGGYFENIKKMIELYHKSILEGNIDDIPITLFYLTKYFKQDLDNSTSANYKLFEDIISIVKHYLSDTTDNILISTCPKQLKKYTNITIAYSRLLINGILEKNFKQATDLLEKCYDAFCSNYKDKVNDEKKIKIATVKYNNDKDKEKDIEQENEEHNYYYFLLSYYLGKCYNKLLK